MLLKTFNFIILILLGAGSLGTIQTALAQAPSIPTNTFSDPASGISFNYPSDWTIASKDYTNSFFGNPADNTASTTTTPTSTLSPSTKPIALVLPQSLDGTNLIILSEVLPFPITVDKYIEITKSHLTTIPMSNAIPFSIANSNGLKYTLSLPNDLNQTQIAFVKGSKAFVVGYNLGSGDQAKDTADINSIINSISSNPEFLSNGQGLTSQSNTNPGNTGNSGMTTTSNLPNSPTSNALANTNSNGMSSSSTSNSTSSSNNINPANNATSIKIPTSSSSSIQPNPNSTIITSGSVGKNMVSSLPSTHAGISKP